MLSGPMPQPAAVLDTNVALDWLLFADPSCTALGTAVTSGRLRWLACPRMRDELADVLARGLAAQRGTAVEIVLAAFDAHAQLFDAPPASALRCADPDDQVFLDLACASAARWLFSRDRAVLRLAPRARPLGLRIVTPQSWEPE
jgi:predicted nucleic acid-binding protein